MFNHKSTPTQIIETHNAVQIAATRAVTKAMREQGITSKLVKKAVLETRDLNKSESSLGNYFSEYYLAGDVKVFIFGEVVGCDKFYSSHVVKNLASKEEADLFASNRLEALEFVLDQESKAVQYA